MINPVTGKQRIASRYIPHGAKLLDETPNTVVYILETGSGQPGAIGFIGTATKPAFHNVFKNRAQRIAFIDDWLSGLEASLSYRTEQRKKRSTFIHSLKVGDILVNSWGYDQTNIDFYQVVKLVGKKHVEIRAIAASSVEETGYMQGNCQPIPGSFLKHSEPKMKLVQEGNCVKIDEWGYYAYPWMGEKEHWTATLYDSG